MARISNSRGGPGRGGGPARRGGWFSSRLFLSIVLVVILFVVLVSVRSRLEGMFLAVLAPLERARIAFDASDNQRLKAELASTTALLADRNALYQENLQLKARLGRDAQVAATLAGVLVRPPAVPYDTLLVDAGKAEGIEQGELVSAGGTTLIGTVAEVYAHTSRVVLFSAPGQTYQVLLRGSIPVSMQGQGGGSFVGQVPAGTQVAEGDSLLFPGIAGGFAGSVSHVTSNAGESFETLYAHLPVDPQNLQFVDIQKQFYAR